jgi:hypothetical protein
MGCPLVRSMVLGLLVTAAFLVPAGSAASRDCPGPNQVPHRDGTYDFTYESWIKKQPDRDHYDFGRCVKNKLGDRSMFVDWKQTGVKGFAQQDDVVDSVIESVNGDYQIVETKLWYGSTPSAIDAPYRERKEGGQVRYPSVRSAIRMAVPSDGTNPEKTLVTIDAEFISDVLRLANGRFMYRYLWRDLLAGTRKPVGFVWQSESAKQALGEFDVKEPALDRSMQGAFIIDKRPPAYSVRIVEFLDQAKRVVGTGPVAVYYPAGTKP